MHYWPLWQVNRQFQGLAYMKFTFLPFLKTVKMKMTLM
jgi:hypothetical protein